MVVHNIVFGMFLTRFNTRKFIYNSLSNIGILPDTLIIINNKCIHNKCFNQGQIIKNTSHISNINVLSSSCWLSKSIVPSAVSVQKSHLSTFNHNCFYLEKLKLCVVSPNLHQWRCKSKKTQKRPEYDSASDSEEEEELSPGEKLVTIKMQSLRMDGLLKKALNLARNKIETSFYEGNIRINGKKPNKKSFQLRVGDEVDLIRGVSPMNPDFLTVSRVEVVSVKEDPEEVEDRLVIRVRRNKSMSIENYQTHPWKKGSTTE